MEANNVKKLCLVCSSGGHLFQLYCLKKFWENKPRFWITFPTQDAQYLLHDEKKYWANYPTNRNVKNLFLNIILAFKILKNENPVLVISTGAGVGVPFIIIARIFRIKTLYLESITRNRELSLSAKLIYVFVDKMIVQWRDLEKKYKKASYEGQVI